MLINISHRNSNPGFQMGFHVNIYMIKVWSDNHYTMGEDSIFNPYTRGFAPSAVRTRESYDSGS